MNKNEKYLVALYVINKEAKKYRDIIKRIINTKDAIEGGKLEDSDECYGMSFSGFQWFYDEHSDDDVKFVYRHAYDGDSKDGIIEKYMINWANERLNCSWGVEAFHDLYEMNIDILDYVSDGELQIDKLIKDIKESNDELVSEGFELELSDINNWIKDEYAWLDGITDFMLEFCDDEKKLRQYAGIMHNLYRIKGLYLSNCGEKPSEYFKYKNNNDYVLAYYCIGDYRFHLRMDWDYVDEDEEINDIEVFMVSSDNKLPIEKRIPFEEALSMILKELKLDSLDYYVMNGSRIDGDIYYLNPDLDDYSYYPWNHQGQEEYEEYDSYVDEEYDIY